LPQALDLKLQQERRERSLFLLTAILEAPFAWGLGIDFPDWNWLLHREMAIASTFDAGRQWCLIRDWRDSCRLNDDRHCGPHHRRLGQAERQTRKPYKE
jgi:hypothetical protein